MSGAFYNVKVQSLVLSGWDVGSCVNFSSAFGSCTNLTELDLSGFDTH